MAAADGPWSGDRAGPFIASLLERMSLAEKIAQLVGVVLPAPGPSGHALDVDAVAAPPGILAVPPLRRQESNAAIRRIQHELVTRTRLGIPALPVALAPARDATRFPPPMAGAATWDIDLVGRMAASGARQSRAAGVLGQLAPGVTVAAGPTPARSMGCFGGSPALAAEMVTAHVVGAQGREPERIDAAHVAAAAVDLGGLGRSPGPAAMTHLDARTMRSGVLAPGRAAVRAGVAMIVPARGGNDGVPAHVDTGLLRAVLRDEWQFEGPVLAAPGAVGALVDEHRVAEDRAVARVLAWEAGVDAVLMPIDAPDHGRPVAAMVERGSLPRWLVDDAVAALLRLKWRLDLWSDPYPPDLAAFPVGAAEAGALAERAAVESLVLVADPAGALPLPPTHALDVWAPGPGAPGAGSPGAPGAPGLVTALVAALPGAQVAGSTATSVPAGPGPLVVVLPQGAPGAVVAEVRREAASGRKCVVLLPGGAPAAGLLEAPVAVLLCWDALGEHPDAVARVLVGTDEPGGRLPVALHEPGAVLPLGHGGGYTSFAYSALQVPPHLPDDGRPLTVRCRITNTGSRAGKEVVQLYLRDRVGSVATPQRVLGAFTAVRLEPGRSSRVSLSVPRERLALWNRSMDHVVEPGTFDVLVGRSADDIRLSARTVLDLPEAPLARAGAGPGAGPFG